MLINAFSNENTTFVSSIARLQREDKSNSNHVEIFKHADQMHSQMKKLNLQAVFSGCIERTSMPLEIIMVKKFPGFYLYS